MVHTTPRLARYPIATYLMIANGFTWLCWIPSLSVAARRGYTLPVLGSYRDLSANGLESAEHLVWAIVFSLAVYGPLLAALVTTQVREAAAWAASCQTPAEFLPMTYTAYTPGARPVSPRGLLTGCSALSKPLFSQ